ncbi:MAG: serine/threonine-protein phosphatase [Stomatobaculum sp.]|nr:serine/threonine-protein phosphatase [Stomatobaculum sp.]
MITFSLLTNPGNRENNEDNIGMYQAGDDYCFVLADGLGGHGAGEIASAIAVEQVVTVFAGKGKASAECLSEAMMNAQNAILTHQRNDRSTADMKTTCTVLMIGGDGIFRGHIGDSRIYYFDNAKMPERTLDHSVPQLLCQAGRIREKDIRHHPDRNRLLRVMGIEWDEPRFELADTLEKKRGQAFLLCSDGFWELIDEKKMVACLKKADSPEEWLKMMELIVLRNGRGLNMDNYSAIGVWVD